jgi:hypothetical protein
MPSLPAGAVDELAWRDVVGTLTDPDRFRLGLDAARAEHAQADGRRRSRLDDLDANVARLRARLDRVIDEQLDAPVGSETARALREKASEIEAAIGRHLAERARLDSKPTAGLSDDQAASLVQFAEEVRAGLEVASQPGDEGAAHRRHIFGLLKLRGTVRLDPERGEPVGKKHRVTIEWQAAIPIRGNGREFTNIQTVVANELAIPTAPHAATSE